MRILPFDVVVCMGFGSLRGEGGRDLAGHSKVQPGLDKAGVDSGLRQALERVTYALKDSGQDTYSGVNSAQRLTLEFNSREAHLRAIRTAVSASI